MNRHKPTAIWADKVRFSVCGAGARTFLGRAAREGVRLSGIVCTGDGYAGYASGTDLPRLYRAAKVCRAELCVRERHGPGKALERVVARPGLAVGMAVFLLLQWYLGGFVWSIDFGNMEPEQQSLFRTALAAEGIREGCRIDEETLRRAQQAMEPELQQEGWLSLNFASGCLFIEENRRQTQSVREETADRALYAKAGGQVLAIELESGFSEVAAGQYVAEGQLLANGQKADRNGEAVVQGASGRILGRMSKTYTAVQPLQTEAEILTGNRSTEESWQVLGHTWQTSPEEDGKTAYESYESSAEWIPLCLGRAALPGGVCRLTLWERETQTVTYSETSARALAARACYLQLRQQFPDAVLETRTMEYERQENRIFCTAEYVFRADMAQPGELSPLETGEITG